MAKFKLDPVEDYPYVLVGLNSTAAPSQLCWAVNREMDIHLRRTDDVEVIAKSGDSTFHALYVYEDPASGRVYRMVRNKMNGGMFLRECPQADVIMAIDDSPPIDVSSLLGVLRNIRRVILAFEVDIDQLKHKENLLYIA